MTGPERRQYIYVYYHSAAGLSRDTGVRRLCVDTQLCRQMSIVLLNINSWIPTETPPRHPIFGTGTQNGMTGWRLYGDSWNLIEKNDWHLFGKSSTSRTHTSAISNRKPFSGVPSIVLVYVYTTSCLIRSQIGTHSAHSYLIRVSFRSRKQAFLLVFQSFSYIDTNNMILIYFSSKNSLNST